MLPAAFATAVCVLALSACGGGGSSDSGHGSASTTTSADGGYTQAVKATYVKNCSADEPRARCTCEIDAIAKAVPYQDFKTPTDRFDRALPGIKKACREGGQPPAAGGEAGSGEIDPTLQRDLGDASPEQLQRAQGYVSCLGKRLDRGKLTLREGSDEAPPSIIASLKGAGTQVGISLAASPADAKAAEKKIRGTGNNALYTKGSTVLAFGGSDPSDSDIDFILGCADKVDG